jgi:hypothetical protein
MDSASSSTTIGQCAEPPLRLRNGGLSCRAASSIAHPSRPETLSTNLPNAPGTSLGWRYQVCSRFNLEGAEVRKFV